MKTFLYSFCYEASITKIFLMEQIKNKEQKYLKHRESACRLNHSFGSNNHLMIDVSMSTDICGFCCFHYFLNKRHTFRLNFILSSTMNEQFYNQKSHECACARTCVFVCSTPSLTLLTPKHESQSVTNRNGSLISDHANATLPSVYRNKT